MFKASVLKPALVEKPMKNLWCPACFECKFCIIIKAPAVTMENLAIKWHLVVQIYHKAKILI